MKILTAKTRKGFTLIELMVVVSIITFLASIIFAQTVGTKKKARDTERMRDLREMQKAIELYRNEYGSFPNTSGQFRAGAGTCAGAAVPAQGYGPTGYIPGVVPTYISTLSEDPLPGAGTRCYIYRSDGSEYMLAAYNGAENFDPNSPAHPFDRPSTSDQSIAVYTSGASTW